MRRREALHETRLRRGPHRAPPARAARSQTAAAGAIHVPRYDPGGGAEGRLAGPDHRRGYGPASRAHANHVRDADRERPGVARTRRSQAGDGRPRRVPPDRSGARRRPDREGRDAMRRGPAFALMLTGVATNQCNKPVNAGDPLRGLSREEQDRFRRGRVVFDSVFTPATGLGPLFNSTACGECHEDPVAGGSGAVVQRQATPALKTALGIDSEPFPKDASGRGLRTTPAIFGRGLLDAVPDAVILSYADSADRNHDG